MIRASSASLAPSSAVPRNARDNRADELSSAGPRHGPALPLREYASPCCLRAPPRSWTLLIALAGISPIKLLAAALLAACCLVGVAHADDAIPASLTGAKGDPARGRAIVANRQVGLCLLCHSGPFPEERFQGNLAPDLRGAGQRWSEGQLRLRIVDSGRINPATIMPAYHRTEGLVRVAPAWRGKPVLSAEQIEDVVAFLMTLRD